MGRLNGKPGAIIAVYQLPGSNAVDAANGVKKLIAGMKQTFPQDMDYVISLDTTKAVTSGIKEIVETLLIAIVLVILVVYIFLQSWRATLIPMLAVPVALIGTFVFFPLFGFSVNTLSLLGLVLAIGLVVDDAIAQSFTFAGCAECSARSRPEVHCGAAVRRYEPGERSGIFLRRHQRRDSRCAGESGWSAGRSAHVVLFL